MRHLNLEVVAAVTIALGAHSFAHAALPTLAQCAASPQRLYIAGSPIAQPYFQNPNDLFDPTVGVRPYSATQGDFKAYCGVARVGNGGGIPAGTVVVIYYRGEAGSVAGLLPIVNGKPINMLDITTPACQIANPVTNGVPNPKDTWAGCVTMHSVDMGITQLEPTAFVAPNDPAPYAPVWGTATKAQLATLSSTALLQEVFAFFVNTNGINGGVAGQAIDLSHPAVLNILNGNYTDWNQVPSNTGGTISSTSQPITLVNREQGSASRAAATLQFLGTDCMFFPSALQTAGAVQYSIPATLAQAAAIPGAITYAPSRYVNPNLSQASLAGVAPTNAAASRGDYLWWYEGTVILGNTAPATANLVNFLTNELQNLATAPHASDVLAIPNVGTNVPVVPIAANTVNGQTIYINAFSRAGNSCAPAQ
jgi:hypothetical protein